jgi:glucose-1-phosphate cytidylyltransferase
MSLGPYFEEKVKVVILAGGRGTRMGEETEVLPKPMITIGGIPIIHHIINWYSSFGYRDFIILGGYKFEAIMDYFGKMTKTGWNIAVIDTGLDTPTGERLLRVEKLLDKNFLLTYGDGLSDVNILKLADYASSRIATVTAVHPPGRFGTLTLEEERIIVFNEKKRLESEWINGGFMVFHPIIFKYIEKDEMLEFDVLPRLAEERRLMVYKHEGFWRCMDTPRDREYLEELWKLKRCPWRIK